MSYSDFLDTLIAPIRMFYDALVQVASSLSHNYIYVTIFGLSLFVSLFWLIVNILHNFIYDRIDEKERFIDKYNEYVLYQDIQHQYLNRHRSDYLDLKMLKYRLSQKVMMDYFYNYQSLLEQFKLDNLKLSKKVTLDYLNQEEQLEQAINYRNYVLHKNTAYEYMIDHKDDDILYRVVNKENQLKASEVLANKDSGRSITPKWLNLNVDKQPLSEEEKKELDNIIKNF